MLIQLKGIVLDAGCLPYGFQEPARGMGLEITLVSNDRLQSFIANWQLFAVNHLSLMVHAWNLTDQEADRADMELDAFTHGHGNP